MPPPFKPLALRPAAIAPQLANLRVTAPIIRKTPPAPQTPPFLLGVGVWHGSMGLRAEGLPLPQLELLAGSLCRSFWCILSAYGEKNLPELPASYPDNGPMRLWTMKCIFQWSLAANLAVDCILELQRRGINTPLKPWGACALNAPLSLATAETLGTLEKDIRDSLSSATWAQPVNGPVRAVPVAPSRQVVKTFKPQVAALLEPIQKIGIQEVAEQTEFLHTVFKKPFGGAKK